MDQTKEQRDAAFRDAGLSGSGTTAPGAPTVNDDPFIKEIRERLLASSGAVSSAGTGLENKIKEAISGITAGNEASKERLESQFKRGAEDIQRAGADALTSEQEAQRGFAVNTAAIRRISEDTDKKVRDLEMRKNELQLAGDAAASEKVSGLILKELEFEQQARQQTFSNMLNLGQFALQGRQEQRLAEQFTSEMKFKTAELDLRERNAIAEIASKYGVTVGPNETIESITSKVAPLARKKLEAEIANLKSKTDAERTDANLDGFLAQEITGGSNPTDAALRAIGIMETLGLKPTTKDLNRLTERANELHENWKIERERVEAETRAKTTNMFEKLLFGGAKDSRQSESVIGGLLGF